MAMKKRTKWSMALVIGLSLGSIGPNALANGGWVSSSTAAYTEVTGALLESNGMGAGADAGAEVAHAGEPGADSYDPYTCAAAYGDAFCAAFERCMAAEGFKTCYERFSQ
jgi:hypothetical protein